jgi:hypothetical protein
MTLSPTMSTQSSGWHRSAAMLILIAATVVNFLPESAQALNKTVSPNFTERAVQSPPIKNRLSNCILEPRSFQCKPGLVFTRGDFAVEAQRMFGLAQPRKKIVFPDVPESSPVYAAAQAVGPFMNWRVLCPVCYLSPNFGPDEPISQAQMTVALVRILLATKQVQLLNVPEADAVLDRFPDASNILAPRALLSQPQ